MGQGCHKQTGVNVRKKIQGPWSRKPNAAKGQKRWKNVRKLQKAARWGSNPWPLAFTRAGLPLGWLYIRLYKQKHKYILENASWRQLHLQPWAMAGPPVSLSFLHENRKSKHENYGVSSHEFNHLTYVN